MTNIARSSQQLGHAIQQHRLKKGMTQTDLALLVGTGQKTISKIENGNPATRTDTLFAIMAALDLQLDVQIRGDVPDDLKELFG